jgi:hypothetical protein
MTKEQLRAFLILLMCSDPWPVNDEGNFDILANFANGESQRHGYNDWIEAYHAL